MRAFDQGTAEQGGAASHDEPQDRSGPEQPSSQPATPGAASHADEQDGWQADDVSLPSPATPPRALADSLEPAAAASRAAAAQPASPGAAVPPGSPEGWGEPDALPNEAALVPDSPSGWAEADPPPDSPAAQLVPIQLPTSQDPDSLGSAEKPAPGHLSPLHCSWAALCGRACSMPACMELLGWLDRAQGAGQQLLTPAEARNLVQQASFAGMLRCRPWRT